MTATIAPATDGFREVWLIRSDGGALISLSVLDGPRRVATGGAGRRHHPIVVSPLR